MDGNPPGTHNDFRADDFGVEFEGSDSEIRKIYDEKPDVITVKWAYDHGFKDF